MQSLWLDAQAREMVEHYARAGVGRDVALRVYTSRLLGAEPKLVLHGGGNTSVKTVMTDTLGNEVDTLCVKGSGWDMADIEPRGLPALRLDALRELTALEVLSDEDMVNYQRGCLLDSTSPNPSVETLLHAFLPHKFIDHTHSTAVLAITDQADGEALAAEVFGTCGTTAALVPYVMPGFALARKAAEVYGDNPDVEGLILLKHGIFSFGDSAREAYERMISLVTLAEERLGQGRRPVFAAAELPPSIASVAQAAPILRGLVAECADADEGLYRRMILDFRTGAAILDYVNGAEIERYSQVGVVTPDHAIRTKNLPLVVPAPEADDLEGFAAGAEKALDRYVAEYHAYFARNDARQQTAKSELDPMPRVVLVPGLGLFGVGGSAKDAAIAADITENTIAVITDAEAVGTYQCVDEADAFDIEYWSLEQAKLGKGAEPRLARHVVLVTGGGGGIGAATAAAFAAEGAEVAVLDRDGGAAEAMARGIGGAALAITCDVTDADAVGAAYDEVLATFGGLDIVVSNAGAASQGKIGEVADEVLRASFELNFFAHQSVARNAVRVMLAQGTGGVLLFNASKQAFNPGLDFGPYGLPKAATIALARQYALDYGADGIRSNAVNADRVNTGIFSGGLLEERAAARGLGVADYLKSGNLLKREVKADDVAQAFVSLALARKTTAAVLTVDGGNIAAAPR